jgi:hypothetical protein
MKSEIIAYTQDGRVLELTAELENVNGFPVSAGSALAGTPILFNNQGKASIAVIDTQNVLYVWTIGSVEGKFFWNEENGNHFNASFADAADGSKLINEFFPYQT